MPAAAADTAKPPPFKIWLLAARPRTLPASVAPVVAASALAWHGGVFHWPAAFACLLFALLLNGSGKGMHANLTLRPPIRHSFGFNQKHHAHLWANNTTKSSKGNVAALI